MPRPSPPTAAETLAALPDGLTLGLGDLPPEVALRVTLFRLTLSTATELQTRMDRVLASSGLTTQQAMLLARLQAEPEPPTLTAFARQLAMSHQNLKQIAQALQRKGFLELRPCPDDRRARRLHLTEQHHRHWSDRDREDFAAVADWTAALDDVQVLDAVGALAHLHADLMRSRSRSR